MFVFKRVDYIDDFLCVFLVPYQIVIYLLSVPVIKAS